MMQKDQCYKSLPNSCSTSPRTLNYGGHHQKNPPLELRWPKNVTKQGGGRGFFGLHFEVNRFR